MMSIPHGALSPLAFITSCYFILDSAEQIWYTQKITVTRYQGKLLTNSISMEVDASWTGEHQ